MSSPEPGRRSFSRRFTRFCLGGLLALIMLAVTMWTFGAATVDGPFAGEFLWLVKNRSERLS